MPGGRWDTGDAPCTRDLAPSYPLKLNASGPGDAPAIAPHCSRRAARRVPAGRTTRPRGAPCHAPCRPHSRTPFRGLRRRRSRDGAPGWTATRARWSRPGGATARAHGFGCRGRSSVSGLRRGRPRARPTGSPFSRIASRRPRARQHRPLRCRPARGAARPCCPAPGPVDCSSPRRQPLLVERYLSAAAAGSRPSCSALALSHRVISKTKGRS
jgi:hypothetical protein